MSLRNVYITELSLADFQNKQTRVDLDSIERGGSNIVQITQQKTLGRCRKQSVGGRSFFIHYLFHVLYLFFRFQ